jgi:tripartite ATP-independent transporter DctM subunit
VFTPTEAAAISAVYAFVISYVVYRELKLSDLPKMFLTAGLTSAVVMIIIGISNVFGMIVAFEHFAAKVETIVRPMGYYGYILLVNLILLWVGTFMDQNPAILILAPVLAPIAHHLGISPIHFGMIVVMNLVIGLITPPFGQILFVVSPIARVSLEEVTKEVLPFLLMEIAVLFLVSYVPFFATYIPGLLGYGH